jgi:RNA-binding protein
MLNSKQRAYLRGLANQLPCIFQIGKGGVTDEIAHQISNALEARELIKVKTLDNCEYSASDAARTIADAVGADVVATVGNRFILYRESEKHKRIELNV